MHKTVHIKTTTFKPCTHLFGLNKNDVYITNHMRTADLPGWVRYELCHSVTEIWETTLKGRLIRRKKSAGVSFVELKYGSA